jgi:hypothetical protein
MTRLTARRQSCALLHYQIDTLLRALPHYQIDALPRALLSAPQH